MKGKPSFKKWCNYCRRYGHSIAECRQKQQDNQNKSQSIENQINHFISPWTENQVITTDKETTLNHLIEIKHVKQNSQQNYRSSTHKHQRQINQAQTTEETQSYLPCFDNIEITEVQLNQIYYESTDSESDTDRATSINMIHVETDYKPIIYEQPIHYHIYQNLDQFLLNYYTRPINRNKTIEKTVEEITEEKTTECSSPNNIYQNIAKETQLPK